MALCRDSNPRGYCAALFVGVQYCFHLHYVSTVIKLAESSLRTFGGEIPAAIARQALSPRGQSPGGTLIVRLIARQALSPRAQSPGGTLIVRLLPRQALSSTELSLGEIHV
jgi:hypothetical protein